MDKMKKIVIGTSISIVITLIGLVTFATFLTYTNIPEAYIPTVIIIITVISILIGSSFSMYKVKKNGILNGTLIGIMYISIIYILSSIIEGDFLLNKYSIIMITVTILSGALGGIIGVNRK